MMPTDSPELKTEISPETTLSDLFKRYGVPREQEADVTRAIQHVFESARAGRLPFRSSLKPLDPDKTNWPEEKFSDARRERGEDIITFLRRVWKPLIDAGAARVDLRREDPSADRAVAAYTTVAPDGSRKALPPDVHVPTKKEVNDRLLESGIIPPEDLERLADVIRRRKQRKMRQRIILAP